MRQRDIGMFLVGAVVATAIVLTIVAAYYRETGPLFITLFVLPVLGWLAGAVVADAPPCE